jgi:hypothetical protein
MVGGFNKRLSNCQAQARGPMGVAMRPVLKCASACGVARCGTPVIYLCIHALNDTVHLCMRSLMHGHRAGNPPNQ